MARVNLGVTTVLTMTTLIASTNAALPKVSYVKSIDVYLGACFFLVFTSLLGNYSLHFWNWKRKRDYKIKEIERRGEKERRKDRCKVGKKQRQEDACVDTTYMLTL